MKSKSMFERLVEKALCRNDSFMLGVYVDNSFLLWADVTNRFKPPTDNKFHQAYSVFKIAGYSGLWEKRRMDIHFFNSKSLNSLIARYISL